MAATSGVWGLDIGHCALKALRCEYDDQNKILVATAYDYIEYPKILTQADANPKELIHDALTQFLERNDLKGDRVGVSVAGQNGLARFFQPPPVDVKKLPEIVKFEARQQIPFPLEEVIWDFQKMGGSTEVDGFLMDAEIGLFAMKRDQVYDALAPYRKADVEVDVIQLAPLCAYNFVAHSLLTDTMDEDIYDPDSPPESFVIVSMGTDTTDLVITNGFRVWQRNIPLGGNHFTKQLTKELKLTFAKAEHLKRNVRDAEDAKSIVQAMRPVFNDLLTEVQRSIGFFQNIDRKAEISGMIMLGNAVKLPGLQQYLAKNLGYELVDVGHERWSARLSGQSVLTSPQFKDNMHAFGVCYGLCLQGLGRAKLETNLLPREIFTERTIRAKKPWALAIAASLMLAFAINFFFEYGEWYKVHPDMEVGGVAWKAALSEVDSVQTESTAHDQKDSGLVTQLDELVALGKELSGNYDRRLLWLELLKAINRALPQDAGVALNEIPDPATKPISQRKDIHVEYIESQYFPDLAAWFSEPVQRKYLDGLARLKGDVDDDPAAADTQPSEAGEAGEAGATATDVDATPSGELAEITPPEGSGWVIEIAGYHFFNEDKYTWGGTHVRDTLIKMLREQTIELPGGPNKPPEQFTMEELGIGFVILAVETRIEKNHQIPNPYYEPPKRPGAPGLDADEATGGLVGATGLAGFAEPAAAEPEDKEADEPQQPPFYIAPRYSFVVQFCWQEKQLTDRLQQRAAGESEEQDGTPPDAGEGVAVTNVGG